MSNLTVRTELRTELSDAELVRSAQSGEVGGLGLLLARHRAGMYAVALGRLGYGSEADDAVQEASLTALRRIGDLRDPNAVAPWLRAIVRNQCRMQLRARTPLPVEDVAEFMAPSSAHDPAAIVDRHVLADWVWHAVEGLSPNLRMVTMLRYFTNVTTYRQIAEMCEIPVGTVRSRLSHARARLAEELLASAGQVHDDARALTEACRRDAEEALDSARHGRFAAVLAERWSPQVQVRWPRGKRTHGFDYLVRAMERDLADGVTHRLRNVVASRDLIIWESDLISPPHDPFHCPPGAVWMQTLEQGRVRRLRLLHPNTSASASLRADAQGSRSAQKSA